MRNPEGLRYTNDHVWLESRGEEFVLGVTHFAQESMGEVSYVDFPLMESGIEKGDLLLSIGSSKAFIDLTSPISGKVVAVNEEIDLDPTLINEDPYGRGWLIKMLPSIEPALEELMDSAAYGEFIIKETT